MNISFVDLKTQYERIKNKIDSRIQKVLEHGQYILGPEVIELENTLASYTGSKYCITVSSGTEALLISLLSIEIQPGDEVITSPFSFISASEVIKLLGAIPVFVDIDIKTCNLNPEMLEKAITKKTKAIIPISLFGQPADMDEVNLIAKKYNDIVVIEDAAQSFGAEYKGKKSCNLSKIGCTSFFPSKTLGCFGDGGAIFTNDDKIAKLCYEIRVHGQPKKYIHTSIGVGGRMDTIQCAVLLEKIKILDSELKARRLIAKKYDEFFDVNNIPRVQQHSFCLSSYSLYTIFWKQDRELAINDLRNAGIPTAVHYPKIITDQNPYKEYSKQKFPSALEASRSVLSIPMHPYLTSKQQEKIMNKILSIA